MKNGGGHFAPELGGHFELQSGGQYHWNLHSSAYHAGFAKKAPA